MKILTTLAVLSLLLLGCAAEQPTEVVSVQGMQLDFTLNDMVKRSDAVVVGVVSETLATTTIDGPAPPGKTPNHQEEFRNYRLSVDTTFYPAGLPASIALMTGPYPVSDNPNVFVEQDDIPELAVGEKVLLFLDRLDGPEYANSPTNNPPAGYSKANWYRPVTGSTFGKLTERDGRWEDTRSFTTISVQEVRAAIDKEKTGS
ncbi:MAG: hypothetical protein OXR67_00625 [Chloroflexota bacterium]|nr:hypothetical protein [Chloroflexota bacterium]